MTIIDELEMQVEANLKRAFEGKLLPQDPEDEPASVLLERIRSARSAQGVVDSSKKKSPRGKHKLHARQAAGGSV